MYGLPKTGLDDLQTDIEVMIRSFLAASLASLAAAWIVGGEPGAGHQLAEPGPLPGQTGVAATPHLVGSEAAAPDFEFAFELDSGLAGLGFEPVAELGSVLALEIDAEPDSGLELELELELVGFLDFGLDFERPDVPGFGLDFEQLDYGHDSGLEPEPGPAEPEPEPEPGLAEPGPAEPGPEPGPAEPEPAEPGPAEPELEPGLAEPEPEHGPGHAEPELVDPGRLESEAQVS